MSNSPRSRRDVLRLGMFAGAAAIGLASTGSPALAVGTRSSGPAPARAPELTGAPGPGSFAGGSYGGTVTTVWSEAPQSFDPALGWDGQSWEAITQLLFTPLLQYAGTNGLPAPSAAAAMPEFSADRTRVTIRLRPDVAFHNGRTVVADDYIYAWTRVLNPEIASWASSYLLSIQGAAEVYEGTAATLAGVRALDAFTLQVTLVAPDITFESLLCQPYMAALPREAVEAQGEDFGRAPVGNGPFVASGWNDAARSATFSRNPAYFFTGTPFLDTVVYRWGITEELQLLQLQGGVADIAGNGLSSNQAALLISQGAAGARFRQPTEIPAVTWVAMNLASGPLADVRVRRALNYATDRRQLERVAFGTSDAWSLAYPADMPDYRRTARDLTYNPARARRILKAAGYGRIPLEFIHGGDQPWPASAQILQQQWAKVGVDITITAMGSAAFAEASYNQQGDLYGTRWYMVQPSALDMVDPCWVTGGSMNYTGYSNARVDELAAAAKVAPSVVESNRLLAQLEKELRDDAAGIFTGSVNFLAGRSPELGNFQYRGENGTYYDRLWVDQETR